MMTEDGGGEITDLTWLLSFVNYSKADMDSLETCKNEPPRSSRWQKIRMCNTNMQYNLFTQLKKCK